jgi:beta-N-acetylhexosaminidase
MKAAAAVLALALLGSACAASGGVVATSAPTTSTTITTSTSSTTTTTESVDVRALAHSVLMVGLPGETLDQATAAHLAAGGQAIILLADNIDSASQLRALTGAAACAAAGPLLVAVDEELGTVSRLSGLVTPLPSTAQAEAMTPLEIELTAQLLGRQMLALGVNVDLAPVLDVVQGSNPVLQGRNLGSDPELVGALGAAFIRGLQEEHVVAVPKHFPGHGRSTTDPHGGVTRIDAPLEDLQAVDFPPFAAAFAAGAQAVMVGHPIYDALDPNLPASISPAVLTLLRQDFGFEGVAVTDALNMPAVATGRTPGEVAVLALAAGEDLLLAVDPAQVEPSVSAIVAAVARGDLPLARLQEAAGRVQALAEAAGAVACPP